MTIEIFLTHFYEHLVHNIIAVAYVIISFQFIAAYRMFRGSSLKNKEVAIKVQKYFFRSLLYLGIIFFLYMLTRIFMDFEISNWFTKICNTILLFVSFYYTATNQANLMVRGVRRE